MGDDVLSQAEVESLLHAIESQQSRAAEPAGHRPASSRAALARGKARVNPYDFKRPERVGQEQMRALQSLHEGFARNFGASLSALLRSIVEVKLTSVDQLTYSEFVFSLENPTCFNLLKAAPLEGHLILDINPSVLYPIIDRLLGGGKDAEPIARRPLTDLELRLISRITDRFLQELKTAWENVLPLTISVERVESNPQLVQIVPPSEVVVLISFEVSVGGVRGMMNLCIPFNSIERIGNKLSVNSWTGYTRTGKSPESMETIGRHLSEAKVEVIVTLAETKITAGDLLELRVGDIITTDQDIRAPLQVAVEGVPKFQALPGALKGRAAFQVLDTAVAGPAGSAKASPP